MSSKTELPTQKKKDDAAKKGQSFKSRDFATASLLLVGIVVMLSFGSLGVLMDLYRKAVESGFNLDPHEYAVLVVWEGLKIILPILFACVAGSALPTLLQTRFVLASEALSINFDALNPVNGFKKMFSLRTIKDLVKALFYLGVFVVVIMVFWERKKALLFAQLNMSLAGLIKIWGELLLSLSLSVVGMCFLVIILDALAEYFLVIKDLKMEKKEVKMERRDQEGSPEIKGRRRDFHREVLSQQLKADVSNSRVILANPTHIAIGIFFKPEVIPIPFISLVETNFRAKEVVRYAEEIGVTVMRDIALVRRMYKKHSRFSFVNEDDIGEVLKILMWLQQVENDAAGADGIEI